MWALPACCTNVLQTNGGFVNELALFAGVGGGLLGTQPLGLRTICGIELDRRRRCLLARRQNQGLLHSFPIWDDVCTFDGRPWVSRVDIITGGFPCQAFSTATRGRHTAIDLWPEMLRISSEIKPEYVFAENVTPKAIERAAKDCSEMGYKTEMLSLSAADLGADHIRERFWLLAYSDDKSKLLSTIDAKMADLPEFCDGFWQTKPDKSRTPHGVARRMDRFSASGNGQVSIVAAAALWALAKA